MSSQNVSEVTPEERSLTKQLNRRRVFGFFFALVALALFQAINEESDEVLHMFDDAVLVAFGILAIVIFVIYRNKVSLPELRRFNNIMLILVAIGIVIEIFAFTQEIGDPADFGNEIPSMIFLVLMLINRFV